jgi:hypothetical protein
LSGLFSTPQANPSGASGTVPKPAAVRVAAVAVRGKRAMPRDLDHFGKKRPRIPVKSAAGDAPMSDTHEAVVQKMINLYRMLVGHNGFGEMSMDIHILKRGQKEVILRCGKQYRFVVDTPGQSANHEEWLTNWKHVEGEASCKVAKTVPASETAGAKQLPPKGGGAGD